MLKETPVEKGCFRGCFFSIVIWGGIGMIAGYFLGGYIGRSFTEGPELMLLKFGGAVMGFLGGSLLGGLVGIVISKFFLKEEEEII